jgi:hypothetical protein
LPLKRWIVPVCAQTVRIKYETVLAFVKHAQLDTLDHTDDDDRLCTLIRPRFLNRKFYNGKQVLIGEEGRDRS